MWICAAVNGVKAVGRDPQAVVANRQGREVEDAVANGFLGRSEARLLIERRDGRLRNGGI